MSEQPKIPDYTGGILVILATVGQRQDGVLLTARMLDSATRLPVAFGPIPVTFGSLTGKVTACEVIDGALWGALVDVPLVDVVKALGSATAAGQVLGASLSGIKLGGKSIEDEYIVSVEGVTIAPTPKVSQSSQVMATPEGLPVRWEDRQAWAKQQRDANVAAALKESPQERHRRIVAELTAPKPRWHAGGGYGVLTTVQEAEAGTLVPTKPGRAVRRAVMIEAGTSANGNTYPRDVLAQAVAEGLFNNVPCFVDHSLKDRSARDKVGTWRNAVMEGDAVVAEFVPLVSWVADMVDTAIREGVTDAVHFSIAADAVTSGKAGQRTVSRIVKVDSVDLVSFGAAGGRLLESAAWHGLRPRGGYLVCVTQEGLSGNGNLYDLPALASAWQVLQAGAPVHWGHPTPEQPAERIGTAGRPQLERGSGLWAAYQPDDLARFYAQVSEASAADRPLGVSIAADVIRTGERIHKVHAIQTVTAVDLMRPDQRAAAGGFVPTFSNGRPIPTDHPKAMALAEAQIPDTTPAALGQVVAALQEAREVERQRQAAVLRSVLRSPEMSRAFDTWANDSARVISRALAGAVR